MTTENTANKVAENNRIFRCHKCGRSLEPKNSVNFIYRNKKVYLCKDCCRNELQKIQTRKKPEEHEEEFSI